jgi:hypothetical protein
MIDPKMAEILRKIERRFRSNSGSLLALAAVLAATLADRPLPSLAEVNRWIDALGSPDAPKDIAQVRAQTLLDVLASAGGERPAPAPPPAPTRAASPKKPQRSSPAGARAAKPATKPAAKKRSAPKRR